MKSCCELIARTMSCGTRCVQAGERAEKRGSMHVRARDREREIGAKAEKQGSQAKKRYT